MNRVWKFADDIDTDQIVPGRYAPYMTSEDELPKFAFIEARPQFAKEVQPGDVLIAGENFGCGSSREYAPLSLKRCGLSAVIARSFSRIFYRNAVNIGLPLVELDLTHAPDGAAVAMDFESCQVVVDNETYSFPEPPELFRRAWAAGGLVHLVLQKEGGSSHE